MIEQIAKLRIELEEEYDLSQEEIAYLEQIQSIQDLGNYGELADLAYDAALALGLSDEEAENIIEAKNETVIPLSENLIKEYKSLVSEVNLFSEIIYEAEYQMVEEVSAEGFVSNKTSKKMNDVRAKLAEAKNKLETFKYENSNFVAQYKAMREEEKESQSEEMFERFWNN